ncbi:hypothetical protein R3P38DRAFT_3274983 [Favolaschia claudopus]|uniref:Uncharacterized protein n=1 Tax=Favolaschia claudopus TaxID=2862362 RepID=A0AAW0AWD7_9AGAR
MADAPTSFSPTLVVPFSVHCIRLYPTLWRIDFTTQAALVLYSAPPFPAPPTPWDAGWIRGGVMRPEAAVPRHHLSFYPVALISSSSVDADGKLIPSAVILVPRPGPLRCHRSAPPSASSRLIRHTRLPYPTGRKFPRVRFVFISTPRLGCLALAAAGTPSYSCGCVSSTVHYPSLKLRPFLASPRLRFRHCGYPTVLPRLRLLDAAEMHWDVQGVLSTLVRISGGDQAEDEG